MEKPTESNMETTPSNTNSNTPSLPLKALPSKSPRLILAPMVRLGTTPFRLLSLRHGADIVYTEETIAKKLRFSERVFNPHLNTYDYYSMRDGSLVLRVHPEEKGKLVLQIGASDPEDALQATLVAKEDIISVDLNMGCPKHFSTHGNMGSALLLRPDIAKEVYFILIL